MSVPPLRLGNNFESYISGEVIIHPSAVIAPGVILQAAPNSKITIGAGVCIGMGSILQVDAGTLEIEAGANLGAGFLMVGKGKIGANACIGAATTVFQSSVAPGQVVAPGSILQNRDRDTDAVTVEAPQIMNGSKSQDSVNQNSTFNGKQAQPEEAVLLDDDKVDVWSNSVPTTRYFRGKSHSKPTNPTTIGDTTIENVDNTSNSLNQNQPLPESTAIEPSTPSANNFAAHIYGQGNVQRLLFTLFPHRQSLNKPISDDSSE